MEGASGPFINGVINRTGSLPGIFQGLDAARPAAGYAPGDWYLSTDTQILYRWTGSAWVIELSNGGAGGHPTLQQVLNNGNTATQAGGTDSFSLTDTPGNQVAQDPTKVAVKDATGNETDYKATTNVYTDQGTGFTKTYDNNSLAPTGNVNFRTPGNKTGNQTFAMLSDTTGLTLQQVVNNGNTVSSGGTVKTVQFTNAAASIIITALAQEIIASDGAGNSATLGSGNLQMADSSSRSATYASTGVTITDAASNSFVITEGKITYTPSGGGAKQIDFTQASSTSAPVLKVPSVGGTIAVYGVNINNVAGTSYTFALGDELGNLTASQNGAATTFTIPTNASVAFAIGAQILSIQDAAGKLTIAAAGGVTTLSKAGNLSAAAQNVMVLATKKATNTWWVNGDLIA